MPTLEVLWENHKDYVHYILSKEAYIQLKSDTQESLFKILPITTK